MIGFIVSSPWSNDPIWYNEYTYFIMGKNKIV